MKVQQIEYFRKSRSIRNRRIFSPTLLLVSALLLPTTTTAATPTSTRTAKFHQQQQHHHHVVTSAFQAPFFVSSSQRRKTLLSLLDAESTLTSTPDFVGGFDMDQMDALAERGLLEAKFMQSSVGMLEEITTATKKKKKQEKKKGPSPRVIARSLTQEGVVRLNSVLSSSTAATLRREILERRSHAFAAISSAQQQTNTNNGNSNGNKNKAQEWRKYFADVLLKKERCDMFLPLVVDDGDGNNEHGNDQGRVPTLRKALREILTSSNILSNTLIAAGGGDDIILYELSSLISEPGSPRQPIHPDNPYQDVPPLFTVFIALQDITIGMGPTCFIPRSHSKEAHEEYNESVPRRDEFLRNSRSVVALLGAGDGSLFDSRTMHCGGANLDRLPSSEVDDVNIDGDDGCGRGGGATRVLLYMSFRNPRAKEPIGNVGSLMPGIQRGMTLRELRAKLIS